MASAFRESMNWLHTWAGVVLGGVLFAIFWMGSLSVFDREIDRWMAPMMRLAAPTGPIPSIEVLRPTIDSAIAARSPIWSVLFPTERVPAMRVAWREGGEFVQHFIDPATNQVLPDPGTLAGTRFLYPFHYMLHIRFAELGYWIVGLAAMAMMALCVSGVVVHRKIFVDFFTFRAERRPPRLLLDLHNVTGVLGLPFHFLISLSGLVIFFSMYFPGVAQIAYKDGQQAFFADAFGTIRPSKAGAPGELASLDAMAAEARRLWNGAPLRYVVVRNPGDARAVVQFGSVDEGSVSSNSDTAYFDGPTGALIDSRIGTPPVMSAQRFISGFHLIQFRHWGLRWIYFGLGLVGCVLIATGYLFWLESRRRKHAQLGLRGVRIVEGLTIGSVTGILIATSAFFVVNRLLPLGTSFLGQERAALEVWTFYLVWLATFGHAWFRPRRAWIDQCRALAGLATAAVLLNWITTGEHLLRSLSHARLWPVAGMDLLLLAGAVIAGFAAFRLNRRNIASAATGNKGRSEATRLLTTADRA